MAETEQDTKGKVSAVHERAALLSAFAMPFGAEIMTIMGASTQRIVPDYLITRLAAYTGETLSRDDIARTFRELEKRELIEAKGVTFMGKGGGRFGLNLYGLSRTGRVVWDGWFEVIEKLSEPEPKSSEEQMARVERTSKLARFFDPLQKGVKGLLRR